LKKGRTYECLDFIAGHLAVVYSGGTRFLSPVPKLHSL